MGSTLPLSSPPGIMHIPHKFSAIFLIKKPLSLKNSVIKISSKCMKPSKKEFIGKRVNSKPGQPLFSNMHLLISVRSCSLDL